MKRIAFVSLFPEVIRSFVEASIPARAKASGAVEYEFRNPRDFCYDPHKKVDDNPYGGHPGLLIKAEPVAQAVESLNLTSSAAIIVTEPNGLPFTQSSARELSAFDELIFVCGHYEGIDHRFEESFATHVFSIGDYVLSNGEIPAMVMADAVIRTLPGVLGSPESLDSDSFSGDGLSAPNYTRPEVWRGRPIPPVLKSGNHARIEEWRKNESEKVTRTRRPDLLPPR